MKKPNITPAEFEMYLKNSLLSIEKSIKDLMAAGIINKQEADRYCLMQTAGHHDPVMVLAIRGYYKTTMGNPSTNDRGIFDDAFILKGPNYFQTFNANTDPRIIKKGVGMLLPGWHLFKQGWHGYGKASGHQAFRTANNREVLPVIRDGEKGIKEGVTVNIHKGGQYQTNSIACQTVIADQWKEFKDNAYRLMNLEGQKVLPYLLLENNS